MSTAELDGAVKNRSSPCLLILCVALGATITVSSESAGAEWHVAPRANPSGDGTARNPWDIETAFRHPRAVSPGDTLWLHAGTYGGNQPVRFTSALRGTEAQPIVVRQFAHERATINGGILAEGEWTWFWGFEITNTSTVRVSNARNRPPGLYLKGRGHRAINLVINNTGHPAIGTWEEVGDGGEVYGCLIWGTGTFDTDRNGTRRGSAIYAQNDAGTRYIRDVISFRNYSTGMKAYTEKAYANGFHFEGNVTFDNGDRLLFVSGRDHPAERVKLINNYTYRAPTETEPPVRLGYPDVDQIDAEISGNYFVNGTHVDGAFWSKRFRSMKVTGNVFVSPNMLATWIPPSVRSDYVWDNNRYYGGGDAPFRIGTVGISWREWKAQTTFDAHSTHAATRPTELTVFIRPNAYDPDRAHVVVYNWPKRDSVTVSLASVLRPGDAYSIVDAQNYWGPVIASDRYDGRPVTLPMNLTAVSQVIGESLVPNVHTPVEFGVFVIRHTREPVPAAKLDAR